MKALFALTGTLLVLVIVGSASGAKSPSVWSVKPTRLSFGSVAAQGQAVLSVTVTNTSTVTEQVAGAHLMTGDIADFIVQGSSSCVFPQQPVFVAAGGSCFVNVVFNPQSVGTFKATMQIDLNPGPPVTINLSGRGT